jgi:hypothetical protein
MQEERKEYSKLAAQMVQDRASQYLSIFVGKHLPLAYPEGIKPPDEETKASRSFLRQWGDKMLPPSSINVADYTDHVMSKVFMNRLVDRLDLQHCRSIFGRLDPAESLLLKHSLSVLFRTREYREHVDPCLTPRSFMRQLVTTQRLIELLIRIDDAFEVVMRPGLVWFGELELLATEVFRGSKQIGEQLSNLQAEVELVAR